MVKAAALAMLVQPEVLAVAQVVEHRDTLVMLVEMEAHRQSLKVMQVGIHSQMVLGPVVGVEEQM